MTENRDWRGTDIDPAMKSGERENVCRGRKNRGNEDILPFFTRATSNIRCTKSVGVTLSHIHLSQMFFSSRAHLSCLKCLLLALKRAPATNVGQILQVRVVLVVPLDGSSDLKGLELQLFGEFGGKLTDRL